jgi:hypothetical protein
VHLPYAGHMLAQQAPHVINDAIQRATLAAQPTRGFGPEAKHERMVT